MLIFRAFWNALMRWGAGLNALARKRQPTCAAAKDLESASRELNEFRSMLEQEEITQEEFDQVRRLLGDQVCQASGPNKKPPTPGHTADGPDANDDFLGIWKGCIQGTTPVHPVRLVGLIGCVDNRHGGHLIDRKPLEGMLQDWIEAGFVAEIRPHTYYDATGQPAPKTFSGITEEAYSEAIKSLKKLGRWQWD
jgi:hypothetical protein